MLLQTNSYIVPKDKRQEHARIVRRFRQILMRLGCDHFEVYEQVGSNWTGSEATGRYVQIMRFRDRQHQKAVHEAEQADPGAQQIIAEFCELINHPYQLQQGLFVSGFYQGVIPMAPTPISAAPEPAIADEQEAASADLGAEHLDEEGTIDVEADARYADETPPAEGT